MKYEVISSTLSWVTKKSFKKGDVVDESVYGRKKTAELVKRGFLMEIKEEAKESVNFEKLTKAQLKEKLQELGVESPEGTKAELIEQLESLV